MSRYAYAASAMAIAIVIAGGTALIAMERTGPALAETKAVVVKRAPEAKLALTVQSKPVVVVRSTIGSLYPGLQQPTARFDQSVFAAGGL
ncbi:hypothetical protein [Bauldia sp.]|uniref:hypothetical protein n=1 Tax=Bauldia sp. TaxID=2575872 RepID=UPI003BAD0D5A